MKKSKKKVKKVSKTVKKKVGSARLAAFRLIDELLEKPKNLKKLEKAFQEAFDEDEVGFYKQFIKPTAEKEDLSIGPNSGVPVAGLRINLSAEKTEKEKEG